MCCNSKLYYSFSLHCAFQTLSGVTMGSQLWGPRQKGPIFKPYRVRSGIGVPFLRSCRGLKFEVTPLQTLVLCIIIPLQHFEHIYICTYIYIYIYIEYIYVCVYIYIYVCICVCIYSQLVYIDFICSYR